MPKLSPQNRDFVVNGKGILADSDTTFCSHRFVSGRAYSLGCSVRVQRRPTLKLVSDTRSALCTRRWQQGLRRRDPTGMSQGIELGERCAWKRPRVRSETVV